MQVKFIHAADIHLDSPLIGLERYEGIPVEQFRCATREAFKNLIDLSIQEKVDFILIAGDLYDGDWRDYNTGLFLSSQVSKLRDAGIKVFIVRGNHDAASQITRQLRLPENVKVFSESSPETVCLDDLGIAIHGQGFEKQSVTADLSLNYPEPVSGYCNIGLLHTSASGYEGHANYAPCDIRYLEAKGYAYWALGHIHKREILKAGDPWIVFPGNTQGRHIRETGAKGCTVVTVTGGRIASVQHQNLDALRWCNCQVDVTATHSLDEVIERCCLQLNQEIPNVGGRSLAVRFELTGACNSHTQMVSHPEQFINNLRAAVNDVGRGSVCVEKVKIGTSRRANPDELLLQQPVRSLIDYLHDLAQDEAALAELLAEFGDLRRVLAPVLASGTSSLLNLHDPDTLRACLSDVEEIITTRVLAGRGA